MRGNIQLYRLPDAGVVFGNNAAFASTVQPGFLSGTGVNDFPLVGRSEQFGVSSSMTTSGAAVITRFVGLDGLRDWAFEDDEEEGSEGWNAGCDDEDEDFVAGIEEMSTLTRWGAMLLNSRLGLGKTYAFQIQRSTVSPVVGCLAPFSEIF